MFSKKNIYRWSGFLLVLGFCVLIFCGPLFRGIIYPTERALFGLGIVILWGLLQLRECLKGKSNFSFSDCLNPDVGLPLAALVMASLSMFWNGNTDSLHRMADYLSLLLMYSLSRKLFVRQKRREYLYTFFIVMGFFHAALGLVYLMDWLPHPWWEKSHFLSGTYVNHNHYAGLLELIFFLCLGKCLAQRQERWHWNVVSLIIIWLALILSLSRGAWISVTLSLILCGLLLMGKKSLRSLGIRILIALVIILFLVIGYLLQGYSPKLSARFQSFGTTEGQFEFFDFRIKLWRSTIDAIKDKPLLGHGPGSFEWAMRPYRRKGFEFAFDYAHNDWLQFTMECGVLFLMIGLIFFIRFFNTMRHAINSDTLNYFRFEELGLRLGIVCLLIHSSVDFNLHIFSNAILFVVFMGLSTSTIRSDGDEVTASQS